MGALLFKSLFGFYGFPNLVHDFPNWCWISNTGTRLSKLMLDFQNGNMAIQVQNWNMVSQIDVGCQYTHGVQTMDSSMVRCTSLEWYCLFSLPPHLPSSPPFLFPVACPVACSKSRLGVEILCVHINDVRSTQMNSHNCRIIYMTPMHMCP